MQPRRRSPDDPRYGTRGRSKVPTVALVSWVLKIAAPRRVVPLVHDPLPAGRLDPSRLYASLALLAFIVCGVRLVPQRPPRPVPPREARPAADPDRRAAGADQYLVPKVSTPAEPATAGAGARPCHPGLSSALQAFGSRLLGQRQPRVPCRAEPRLEFFRCWNCLA